MSDFFTAYRLRLERNEADLLKLADEVLKLNPDIEIYHSKPLERRIRSLTFFNGEEINSVGFHEVPYRWSGCGYNEHSNSHYGGENVAMPFTANDVLSTFKPVTTVRHRHDTFFKSKAEYLKWRSYLIKYQPA